MYIYRKQSYLEFYNMIVSDDGPLISRHILDRDRSVRSKRQVNIAYESIIY